MLQREQQLWDRHSELMETALKEARANYTTLQEAHARLQDVLSAERQAWNKIEEQLRKENAELRAQLLYTAAQLAANHRVGGVGGGSSGGGDNSDDGVLDGRAAAANLPPHSSSHSVHATTSASEQPQPPPPPPPQQQPQQQQSPPEMVPLMPSWAATIEAAIEAVDHIDVLTEDVDYTAMARNKIERQKKTAITVDHSTPSEVVEENDVQKNEANPNAAPPTGPPPLLSIGSEDIFWVNQLHTALIDAGYYPGDDDIDVFFFGDSTQSALMTFQACEGLDETGVVDDASWVKLLGPELTLKETRDLFEDQMSPNFPGITNYTSGSSGGTDSGSTDSGDASTSTTTKKYTELFSAATETTTVSGPDGTVEYTQTMVSDVVTDIATTANANSQTSMKKEVAPKKKWVTLMEGDGGREVHSLHVLLDDQGFAVSEEDCHWWHFGSTTLDALKTFQACNGLPESGVCDANTWKKLLGEGARPEDVGKVESGRSDDEDMTDDAGGTRVWLMCEDRWEDRDALSRKRSAE